MKIVFAATIMAVMLHLTKGDPQSWIDVSIWQRVGKLFVLIALGGLVYFASLLLVGIRPKNMLMKATIQ